MTEQIMSKEEFTNFYIYIGITNHIDIEMGYRLYLALLSKDLKKIAISENNIRWNQYFKNQDRLN